MTKNMYILHPREEKWLDCYINADFVGMWNMTNLDDLNSAKSRTRYVIIFTNCLVLWIQVTDRDHSIDNRSRVHCCITSNLQYHPMCTVLDDVANITSLKIRKATVHSTIFEDNMGFIELVNAPKM